MLVSARRRHDVIRVLSNGFTGSVRLQNIQQWRPAAKVVFEFAYRLALDGAAQDGVHRTRQRNVGSQSRDSAGKEIFHRQHSGKKRHARRRLNYRYGYSRQKIVNFVLRRRHRIFGKYVPARRIPYAYCNFAFSFVRYDIIINYILMTKLIPTITIKMLALTV